MPSKSAKPVAKRSIYQLKITLRWSKPPIWRRIQVDSEITLKKLHHVIQQTMGWTDSHLHQFVVRGVYFSDPQFELEHTRSESTIRLNQIVPREGLSFTYEYDFGDGWQHEVKVEKIIESESAKKARPVCLAGKRACPPEDCGGTGGYYNLLRALADPKHEDHRMLTEWIGGSFDPEAFDLDTVNALLGPQGDPRQKRLL